MVFDFVINSLGSGGAEKQLLMIAQSLAANDHTVSVTTLDKRTPVSAVESEVKKCAELGIKLIQPQNKTGTLVALWRAYRHLVSTRTAKQRVIWAWGSRAEVLCKLAAKRSRGDWLISSLRSAGESVIHARKRSFRFLHNKVDGYIANSESNIEKFLRIVGPLRTNFSVLYNVVEKSETAFNNRRPNVASFSPEFPMKVVVLGNNRFYLKGYDLLLDCAQTAMKAGNNWQFHIAGRDYDGNLQTEIDRRKLGNSVEYFGVVDQVDSYFSEGDVYLLPSRVEGMPNALLEAMQFGIPCVSTKVGDLEALFSDKGCLRLVETGNSLALVNALMQVEQNYVDALRMGRVARREIHQRFGRENLYVNVKRALSQVLSNKGLQIE